MKKRAHKPSPAQLRARAKFAAMARAKSKAAKGTKARRNASTVRPWAAGQTLRPGDRVKQIVPAGFGGGRYRHGEVTSVKGSYALLEFEDGSRQYVHPSLSDPANVNLSKVTGRNPKRARKSAPKHRAAFAIGSRVRLDRVTVHGRKVTGVWRVVGRKGSALRLKHPSHGDVIAVPPKYVLHANPSPALVGAKSAFKDFHWGDEARKVRRVKISAPPKALMEIGELMRVDYRTRKGGKRGTWFHELGEGGGKRPRLAADDKGRLHIIGGTYRIRPEGIVG